jgi:CRP-like cAMP-binding protein
MPTIIPRQVLQRSLVLAALPESQRDLLVRKMRERRFKRGEVVFHQGDPGETLHVVLDGSLKVFVPKDAGDDAVLAILGPGAVFGEIALLDAGPRSATVRAITETRTATLHRADLLDTLRRQPEAVEALVVTLTRLVRRLTDDLVDLSALDVTARLARKLLDLAGTQITGPDGAIVIPPVTQDELAGMVAATRASVNKSLGLLEKGGTIERRGRRIAIRSIEKLRRQGRL